MKFGNIELTHGLFLAPLAGYSDRAMRRVCRMWGAEFEVSEMVSSRAVCYQDQKTHALARILSDELPAAVQLFGNDPACMGEAAAIVAEGMGGGVPPSAIDINMGCPVRKIVTSGDGSALMRDPALVLRIVSAVVRAVSLPVTVKLRAGWDADHVNAVEVAKAAEEGGASMICVHGRTREQMYAGRADRAVIRAVKEAVSLPVVGNGDIASAADARQMLDETACDGLMIGRGAVGNPFLFAEIAAMLEGRPYTPPTREERIRTALLQLRLAVEEKGERVGVAEARKQFAEYVKGERGAALLRGKMNAVTTLAEAEALAEAYLADGL